MKALVYKLGKISLYDFCFLVVVVVVVTVMGGGCSHFFCFKGQLECMQYVPNTPLIAQLYFM